MPHLFVIQLSLTTASISEGRGAVSRTGHGGWSLYRSYSDWGRAQSVRGPSHATGRTCSGARPT